MRQNGEQTQWFPFSKFKFDGGGSVAWTLEHIHAQKSVGLKTQEQWKEWLSLHIPSVKSIDGEESPLAAKMAKLYGMDKLSGFDFDDIQKEVFQKLSVQGNVEYMHSISNLALLNLGDNAALNNSTFDVKRNAVVEMDKKGSYIPFCTKMVFLKYYTDSDHNQLHFWGKADRDSYVKAMNSVLRNYLQEDIVIEKEVEE